jgi:GH24 family phage-related lysozyme (muramidase)
MTLLLGLKEVITRMVDFWEKDEVVQKKNFWDDDEIVDVIGETLDTRARQSAMEAETVVEETKPQAVDTFMDKLTERLISLEKFSPTAYRAVKDEKFLTYGYGHYGKDVKPNQKITKEEALDLLEKDIGDRLPNIQSAISNFGDLSEELRVEIAQSWFRGGMSGSPATIKLINQGKFKAAATEFLDNKEYLTAKQRGRAGIIPRMDAVANALNNEGTK